MNNNNYYDSNYNGFMNEPPPPPPPLSSLINTYPPPMPFECTSYRNNNYITDNAYYNNNAPLCSNEFEQQNNMKNNNSNSNNYFYGSSGPPMGLLKGALSNLIDDNRSNSQVGGGFPIHSPVSYQTNSTNSNPVQTIIQKNYSFDSPNQPHDDTAQLKAMSMMTSRFKETFEGIIAV
jgi:hypothetical protein